MEKFYFIYSKSANQFFSKETNGKCLKLTYYPTDKKLYASFKAAKEELSFFGMAGFDVFTTETKKATE